MEEQKKRVLIVEDEFINLDLLRSYLEKSGYEISGDAMRADEAIEVLEQFDTDIAILDINIKGDKDGLWLAEQIQKHYHIPFIFLTAYSDKDTVKKAANLHPHGYLVKPFTQADIFTSVEVALKNYAKEHKKMDFPQEFLELETELKLSDSLFVKDSSTYKKLLIKDIQYIQSFKNYVEIFMKTGRVIVRSSLQKILQIFPQTHFVQVHRSFVVNINFIESIDGDFIFIENRKIPLSKSNRNDLFQKIHFLG